MLPIWILSRPRLLYLLPNQVVDGAICSSPFAGSMFASPLSYASCLDFVDCLFLFSSGHWSLEDRIGHNCWNSIRVGIEDEVLTISSHFISKWLLILSLCPFGQLSFISWSIYLYLPRFESATSGKPSIEEPIGVIEK